MKILVTDKMADEAIQVFKDSGHEVFFDEMDALNIEHADAYPRATSVIPQIIQIT